ARLTVANTKAECAVVSTSLFIPGVAVFAGPRCPTLVSIELEVDNGSNRIRSVGGRSAIFQDFDALNGWKRNGVQVSESSAATTESWKRRNATAIDQNECGTHVETTQ